eukprot:m.85490 g.85490  ORF g.85490 m.85490 type:complete len:883 (+) comp14427_c1_seq1:460-3108(+)
MSATARSQVTVRVPATTANLGPAFDSMGLAVNLWNELTVELATTFSIHIEGEGADVLPRNEENFVVKGVKLAFQLAKQPMPTLAFFCKNGIPFGSGLGSSSAGIVSGIMAGLVLAGKELHVSGQEELLQLAASVEGHIDNLAPCIYGGMQIGIHTGTRWSTTNVTLPSGLQCVVFVPSTPMSTHEARAMLPQEIPREDAIFNIGRTALFVNAILTNNLDELREATQDRLHQPIRGSQHVMPALYPVIDAAVKAGAKGAFLSGAGSSIMALTAGMKGDALTQFHGERCDKQVADAMVTAAATCGVSGRVIITRPTSIGAHVVSVKETIVHGPGLGKGMRYVSTRRQQENESVSFEEAVMQGLAPDGGLYVPKEVPMVSQETLRGWSRLTFPELATEIMRLYIGEHEIPSAALSSILHKSYERFSSSHVTPLVKLTPSHGDEVSYILEQFHGPTCAFKDVALQFVGNLFEFFLARKNAATPASEKHTITVLGATSGDTGSAAIEGLRGKENVEVFILHPHQRVAPIQEAQMTSILDPNVHNVSVKGAFDDCQSMVKALFQEPDFRDKHNLAAINSINWARILAQIVYYFYMYFRWVELEGAEVGAQLNVVVPTGNFGNVLAGFYAKRMGLPIGKLIAATNRNDILYRFLRHRDYTARPVEPSLAPAMDIVVPSNFERFLYFLMDNDPSRTRDLMDMIKRTGTLDLGENKTKLFTIVDSFFNAGRASDEEIREVVADYRQNYNYLACPHTATALHTMRVLRREDGQLASLPTSNFVCLATAHPGKFGDSDEPSDVPPAMPPQLQGLLSKPRRCEHIDNDIHQLQALMETTLAKRNEEKRVNMATQYASSLQKPNSMWSMRWDLVGAVLVGCVAGVAITHAMKKHA